MNKNLSILLLCLLVAVTLVGCSSTDITPTDTSGTLDDADTPAIASDVDQSTSDESDVVLIDESDDVELGEMI